MVLIYIRKVEFDSKKYVEIKENRDMKENERQNTREVGKELKENRKTEQIEKVRWVSYGKKLKIIVRSLQKLKPYWKQ